MSKNEEISEISNSISPSNNLDSWQDDVMKIEREENEMDIEPLLLSQNISNNSNILKYVKRHYISLNELTEVTQKAQNDDINVMASYIFYKNNDVLQGTINQNSYDSLSSNNQINDEIINFSISYLRNVYQNEDSKK